VLDFLTRRNLLTAGKYKRIAELILEETRLKVSHETVRSICLKHRPEASPVKPEQVQQALFETE
jgi:hypothetical protein